jgi:hypothetical protein
VTADRAPSRPIVELNDTVCPGIGDDDAGSVTSAVIVELAATSALDRSADSVTSGTGREPVGDVEPVVHLGEVRPADAVPAVEPRRFAEVVSRRYACRRCRIRWAPGPARTNSLNVCPAWNVPMGFEHPATLPRAPHQSMWQ